MPASPLKPNESPLLQTEQQIMDDILDGREEEAHMDLLCGDRVASLNEALEPNCDDDEYRPAIKALSAEVYRIANLPSMGDRLRAIMAEADYDMHEDGSLEMGDRLIQIYRQAQQALNTLDD